MPADSPQLAGLLAANSFTLLELQAWQAAETSLRECLTIQEKILPDDWPTFYTKSMLGGALTGQKKFKQAEPLLIAGYQGIRQREATIPAAAKIRLTEALRRLIDLYTAWEKPPTGGEVEGGVGRKDQGGRPATQTAVDLLRVFQSTSKLTKNPEANNLETQRP